MTGGSEPARSRPLNVGPLGAQMTRSLEDVLRSTSDVLFPGDEEERVVTVNSRSSEGDTPLHVMAWRKDIEGASILIAAGADINAIGDMDQTPLHVAIMQDDANMVELLIKAGAQTNLRSEFGKTALEEANEKAGRIQTLVQKRACT